MIHLLDTSALLAHARGESGAARVQQLFEREDTTLLLCCVSLAEMARRLRELGASDDEAWKTVSVYEQLVDELVPVDELVAREADRLGTIAGERLPLMDAFIAAAARVRQAVLVHRDRHMRSIPAGELAQLDLSESATIKNPDHPISD